MNKQIWLVIYLNNEIYGSLSIVKSIINSVKRNYIKELSSMGKVSFKVTNKEPFYGW